MNGVLELVIYIFIFLLGLCANCLISSITLISKESLLEPSFSGHTKVSIWFRTQATILHMWGLFLYLPYKESANNYVDELLLIFWFSKK